MRFRIGVALLLLSAGCDRQTTEPCTASTEKPILEISAAQGRAAGAPIPTLSISRIMLNGFPVDTGVLRTDRRWNVERTANGFTCTLPCLFGQDPGTYTFVARSTDFYPVSAQVVADYSAIPAGCPPSHGTPTDLALALTEADSARVSFGFATRAATGLGPGIVAATFDDGSGPTTVTLGQTYVTRNAGTICARRFVFEQPCVGRRDDPAGP